MPVTIPEPAPTVPTVGVLLLHAPNNVASLRFVVNPTHTSNVPVIDDGFGLTVKVTVLPDDRVVAHPKELVIAVIVTVVDPVFDREVVVNVPLDAPIVRVAVFPVAVFAPLKS